MDKIILHILFFYIVLYKTVDAAVAIYPHEEKPHEFKYDKGCYLSSLLRLLEVNVPYSPQDGVSCEEYLCKEDNGETSLFTCGRIAASEECDFVPGNKTLPYPDCCDSYRCDGETESDY